MGFFGNIWNTWKSGWQQGQTAQIQSAQRMADANEDVYNELTGNESAIQKKEENKQVMVNSATDDAITKKANELGLRLDDATKDLILQLIGDEQMAQYNYDISRAYNKNYYSDLVQGLRKAGINPFLALSGLSGTSLQNGASVSGGYYTSKANQQSQNRVTSDKMLMAALSAMATALVMAMF